MAKTESEEIRRRLEEDMKKFFENGGKIEEVPRHVSGAGNSNADGWREWGGLKRVGLLREDEE